MWISRGYYYNVSTFEGDQVKPLTCGEHFTDLCTVHRVAECVEIDYVALAWRKALNVVVLSVPLHVLSGDKRTTLPDLDPESVK